MKPIKTTDDIKQLGVILGVWAHPDDETYSMGGIMSAAIRNGQTVACVTATKGEQGIQDESRWPADKLADIRAKELKDAYEILGIKNHHWLDYPDGGCAEIDENEAVSRVAALIQKYQPDSILSFGPEGMTGHEDHKTVSRWAGLAREKAGSRAAIFHSVQTTEQYKASLEADKELDIFFNIDQPPLCDPEVCDVCYDMPDDIFGLKIEALRAMPSQTEAMLNHFADTMRLSVGTEAFVRAH